MATALQREHREIDAGIDTFVRAGDVEALTRAMRALRRHIYLEEEFLFPSLRQAGLVAPIFVMLREHGQLRTTLDTLDAALTGNTALDAVRDLCRQLTVLEQHHNPKEERILYPQADHVLTAPAAARLQGFLASGVLPDGWACERAESSRPAAPAAPATPRLSGRRGVAGDVAPVPAGRTRPGRRADRPGRGEVAGIGVLLTQPFRSARRGSSFT